MAFHGVRRDLVPLATLLTIVPVSALVLAGSRAGIIGFGLEVGILVLLARSRNVWQGRQSDGCRDCGARGAGADRLGGNGEGDRKIFEPERP